MTKGDPPWLWLIGGPNGAGKTTLASAVLGSIIPSHNFLNADIFARTLAPDAPEKASIPAGRLLIKRMDNLVRARESFAVETTLSSRGYLRTIAAMRSGGWRCGLLLVWLASVDLSLARVRMRVAAGGHGIPERDIRRRYGRIRENLSTYVHAVDIAAIFDNSSESPILAAVAEEGHVMEYVPNATVLECVK